MTKEATFVINKKLTSSTTVQLERIIVNSEQTINA